MKIKELRDIEQKLIGKILSKEEIVKTTGLTKVRLLDANSVYSSELISSRLNVHCDKDGIITSVHFG